MYVGSCLLLVAKAVADLLVNKLRSLVFGPEPLRAVRLGFNQEYNKSKERGFQQLDPRYNRLWHAVFNLKEKKQQQQDEKRRKGMEVVCEGEMTGLVEE